MVEEVEPLAIGAVAAAAFGSTRLYNLLRTSCSTAGLANDAEETAEEECGPVQSDEAVEAEPPLLNLADDDKEAALEADEAVLRSSVEVPPAPSWSPVPLGPGEVLFLAKERRPAMGCDSEGGDVLCPEAEASEAAEADAASRACRGATVAGERRSRGDVPLGSTCHNGFTFGSSADSVAAAGAPNGEDDADNDDDDEEEEGGGEASAELELALELALLGAKESFRASREDADADTGSGEVGSGGASSVTNAPKSGAPSTWEEACSCWYLASRMVASVLEVAQAMETPSPLLLLSLLELLVLVFILLFATLASSYLRTSSTADLTL